MRHFFSEIASIRKPEEVRKYVSLLADRLGYGTFIIAFSHVAGPVPELIVHNFNPAWDGQGEPELINTDPVSQLVQSNTGPVIWGEDVYVSSGHGDLWDMFSGWGMSSGIDVPLALPDGRRIVVGLSRDGELPVGEEVVDQVGELEIFTRCLSAIAPPLLEAQIFNDKLSPLERELLRWVFEGEGVEQLARRTHRTQAAIKRELKALAARAGVPDAQAAAVMMQRCYSS